MKKITDTLIYISVMMLLISSLSFFIFLKSFNNLDVEGDGFIYLTFSKFGILLGRPIRSPLIRLFLIPDIHLARIEMIIFHALISVLLFLIIKKITNNNTIGFFGGILYGACWWYVDFTRYTLMELPTLFLAILAIYILTNQNRLKYFISGILFGLAFIIKPTYGLFFIAASIVLFFKKNRSIILFLVSFLLIAVFLELLLDYIILKPKIKYLTIVYTPWELFKFNFLSRTKFGGFHNFISLNYIYDRILLTKINPLIEPIFRWILFPTLPFFIIGFCSLLKKLDSNKTKIFLIGIALLYLVFNSFLLFSLQIPDFRPDLVKIPKTHEIASNYPQAVSYYSGEGSLDIFLRERRSQDDINTLFDIIGRYKYFVLFDHKSTNKNYFEVLKTHADSNLELIDKYENGLSIYVYRNPRVILST